MRYQESLWYNLTLGLPRLAVLKTIRVYQRLFSPDHGPLKALYPYGYCRFHPSCSEYGYQAVERFGIIRGLPMAAWRVLRCTPWSKGGLDPVPKRK